MEYDIQKALMQAIVKRYEKTSQALPDLQKILNISQSAVYKRLSGLTQLTSSEIGLLIRHYQISPSSIFKTTDSQLLFDFIPMVEPTIVTGNFLSRIKSDLEQVVRASNAHIRYISTDIPFFYYFLQPEIAWFKMLSFQFGLWDKPISKLPKISFSSISNELLYSFEEVLSLYCQVSSEEIWTSRAFVITVDQIKYFASANLFLHPEDSLCLLDKLLLMTDQILQLVEQGDKGTLTRHNKGGTMQLYYNDIDRFNPTILTTYGDFKSLYLTYSLPNFLHTKEPKFIEYTEAWINRIKSKAYNLSLGADIERLHFFRQIKKTISDEKERLREQLEAVSSGRSRH